MGRRRGSEAASRQCPSTEIENPQWVHTGKRGQVDIADGPDLIVDTIPRQVDGIVLVVQRDRVDNATHSRAAHQEA
jgi:hypothetical protein